ncbi:restriction endonuclease subunit S [Lachnospira pectinoschiza]|uniref:Type I restriction enzyme, S subunit n=1 Tax=Lachnospira pectinoschiza TaxID=28052 RepID=A0A1G9UFC0_9FIRM|nr:restriction endonuclease subunit S [Lachnospira pectinoschiza]SDM58619.1 type I restriction enzyme, S subunit [Lachnospira pectinoschiza]
MRVERTEFAKFSKYSSLRLTSNYELPKLAFPYDDFSSFLDFIESGSRPKGGIKDEDYGQALSLGGEQIDKDGIVNTEKMPYVPFDFYDNAKKGLVCDGDILICKDGALTGKCCIVDFAKLPTDKVMINEHVFIVRANSRIRQKMLFYLMRTDFFNSQVIDLAYRKKAQPGLTLDHIKALKIPELSLKSQDEILKKLIPYEEKINKLNAKKVNIQEIIDKSFSKAFGFSYDGFDSLKGIKAYRIACSDVSVNGDLRCGVRFHRPARVYVEKELQTKMKAKIKDYLAEPIVLGASISPSDYDDGDYIYISMATIKGWRLDNGSASTVSDNYLNGKKDKTVSINDIILARSGEGTIGKVALIDEDVKGVFADFTMRIRLKNYNPEFAYYYFRTSYFQYLIETYKKGLGNNTNIFPVAIKEFPIPDIDLKKQKEIVAEIRKMNDQQKKIAEDIADQQVLIQKVIEDNLYKTH